MVLKSLQPGLNLPGVINGENVKLVSENANFGNGSAVPGVGGDRDSCFDGSYLEIRDGLSGAIFLAQIWS
jgi:hypothetical protein